MGIRALHTAATGMQAQQTGIDVIAHNLANVNTVGFKKQRADFEDLFYAQLTRAGTTDQESNQRPVPVEVGHGVRLSGTPREFSQGSFRNTQVETDLAIQGRGFFQVTVLSDTAPNNVALTRAGNFAIDSDGQLVTQNGFKIEPAITVPQNTVGITVSLDGVVRAVVQGVAAPADIGTLELASFRNPGGLEGIGDNLFIETEASGTATTGAPGAPGFGVLRQGFLEEANVNVVTELVQLINTQRAYEVNAKSIETADQMLRTANSIKR